MCEIVEPSTTRIARGACEGVTKTNHDIKNRKKGYEGQVQGYYLGEILQKARGHDHNTEQIYGQVIIVEAPNKIQ